MGNIPRSNASKKNDRHVITENQNEKIKKLYSKDYGLLGSSKVYK